LPKTGCADIVHCSISYSLFIIHHSLLIIHYSDLLHLLKNGSIKRGKAFKKALDGVGEELHK